MSKESKPFLQLIQSFSPDASLTSTDALNHNIRTNQINMASNGTQNLTTINNMTRDDEGETSKGFSPDFIQVCHFLIYAIWVSLQGLNTFLWWHVTIKIL